MTIFQKTGIQRVVSLMHKLDAIVIDLTKGIEELDAEVLGKVAEQSQLRADINSLDADRKKARNLLSALNKLTEG